MNILSGYIANFLGMTPVNEINIQPTTSLNPDGFMFLLFDGNVAESKRLDKKLLKLLNDQQYNDGYILEPLRFLFNDVENCENKKCKVSGSEKYLKKKLSQGLITAEDFSKKLEELSLSQLI